MDTVCPVHPGRSAIGVCVICRRLVCADCSTRLDGINHCRSCLEKKIGEATGAPAGARRRVAERGLAAAAIAVAFGALTFGFYVAGARAADIDAIGSKYRRTKVALAEAAERIAAFRREKGRYPDFKEFTIMEIDATLGRVFPAFVDGYGRMINYVDAVGRARPAVVSYGPNGRLETDLKALRRGDPAAGDDLIRWVP